MITLPQTVLSPALLPTKDRAPAPIVLPADVTIVREQPRYESQSPVKCCVDTDRMYSPVLMAIKLLVSVGTGEPPAPPYSTCARRIKQSSAHERAALHP